MATLNLAEIQADRGRPSEAIDLFREAIELLRDNADHWYEGRALTNLGRALRHEGRTDEAREAWQGALRIFDEFGAPDGEDLSRTELTELLATVE